MSSSVDNSSIDSWIPMTCAGEMQPPEPVVPKAPKASSRPGGGIIGSRMVANAVFIKQDNLWDNGQVITYSFIGPAPLCGTRRQQSKVNDVLNPNFKSTWTDYANIKFQLLPDQRSTSPVANPSGSPAVATSINSTNGVDTSNVLIGGPNSVTPPKPRTAEDALVRIQFESSSASWAFIGREALSNAPKSKPTMNLGWIADNNVLSDAERGLILHEFGHVLGLVHEHQSPAMGGVVTLNPEAVTAMYTKTYKWKPEQIQDQILKKYQEGEVTNFTVFDRKSIMIYYLPRELTMESIALEANDALSPRDKAFTTVHYPFFGEAAKRHKDADIRHALEVLDIAPEGFSEESQVGPQAGGLQTGGTDAGDELLPHTDDGPVLTQAAEQDDERQRKLRRAREIMELYDMRDWRGIRAKVAEVMSAMRKERAAVAQS